MHPIVTPLADRIAEARRLLHGHYGFADFRPVQRRVVQSVLAGRDALAVLPTGGGKSICFQVPALVLGGLTVVVSPLLALMQDQVGALRHRGIAAGTLNSSLTPEEQAGVMAQVLDGSLRLLYISPERAPRLAEALAGNAIRPRLLAVDEAHCISEWGHDFRPSYRELATFRTSCGSPPTIALTGTATPAVRGDIIASLGLRKHDLHLASFNRPNLHFDVHWVPRPAERLPALRALLARKPGLTIVYVQTRASADALAQALWFGGIRSAAYHAGLPREQRTQVLTQFLAEDLDVVVATSAFGMGIDAPRVRLVVHWGMPATPEAYYQEAGRGGRDGGPARCILLHHPTDAEIHRRQIGVTFPPRKTLEELWAHPEYRRRHPAAVAASAERLAAELGLTPNVAAWQAVERRRRAAEARLLVMERYAGGKGCRRAVLLEYFGQQKESCDGCDRCGSASRVPPASAGTGEDDSGASELGRLVRRLARHSASARR
ncbi:MAG: ATP-dependent DNA helicase RecQ [Gemmatimonadales bacterium]